MDEDADICLYIIRIPHEMKGFDIISFSHTMSIYVQLFCEDQDDEKL